MGSKIHRQLWVVFCYADNANLGSFHTDHAKTFSKNTIYLNLFEMDFLHGVDRA